jgi:transposase
MQRCPADTLSERREFLKKAAGGRVSDSTVSRMLRRQGWGRKRGRRVRDENYTVFREFSGDKTGAPRARTPASDERWCWK